MARPTNDEKLIKENPKASPYELLQLGLSQKKYEEMIAQKEEAKPQQLQPEIKQVQPRVMPKLKPMQASGGGDMAYLVNLKTGNKVRMTRHHAEKMARKSPNQFSVQ